ncbi:MAG TPA: histidine kinase N-terminal 7TM domain-containing protein, partial [Thermodesulfovibrionales bacterium]|nr:histidine kinase N-terminal 7TM domain-containing protein [Thermodesulfovibrionales bacterium]
MNLFALSGLSVGISCLALSFLAFLFGKHRLHRLLSFFNLVVAVWGFGLFWVGMSDSAESALAGWKMAHLGGFIVGPLFYHLTSFFCGTERRKLLYSGYIQGIVFIVLAVGTNLLFNQTRYAFGLFFPEATPLYALSVALYIFFVVKGFSELLQFLGKTKGYKRTQTLYIIYGFMFGFIGATTVFGPTFRIDLLYPAGSFGITIYVFIITYAILRHRIMDLHFILRRTVTYSLSVGLLTGIFITVVLFTTNYLKDYIGIDSFILTVGAALLTAFLFTPIKNAFQSVVDKVFFKTTYDYYRTIQNISRELAATADLRRVQSVIVDTLFETLRTEYVSLLARRDECYRPVYVQSAKGQTPSAVSDTGIDPVKGVSKEAPGSAAGVKIDREDDLISFLKNRDIVVMDELTALHGPELSESLRMKLAPFTGTVIAPIFIENVIEYMIILGEKSSGDMFSHEDINLIDTLAKQAAIALKNAILYEDLEQRVRIRTSELSSVNKQLSDEIIERRRAEDALNVAHKELELRIKERTADLIASNQLLQAEIAERKKLEEQLLHAEKMKAVGTLTGGIAHEFNNIVSSIIGYGELLQENIPVDDPLRRYADIIHTSG